MDIDEARKRIDRWFPDLAAAGYEPQSVQTADYNCIAWAAGEDHRRWDPAPGYYWPAGVERDDRIETLVRVFELLGYKRLEHHDALAKSLEIGVRKVAIYADVHADSWTHAARQLPNGKWTSKLGDFEDVEHDTPEGLVGSFYMNLACIMKR
jgi:hypothetical protein